MNFFVRNYLLKRRLRQDQQGIMNRYIAEQKFWAAHLGHTQKFIESQLRGAPGDACVAVLGSGWLLDVPLDFLAGHFREVVLADIRHPAQIRRKIASYPNVTCVETDLTGGAMDVLLRQRPGRQARLPNWDYQPEKLLHDKRPAILLSVNILSQLSHLLKEYMPGRWPDALMDSLHQKIQQQHLSWLRMRPSLLITDYAQTIQDKKTGMESRETLLKVGLPEAPVMERWTWQFDTRGNYYPGKSITLHVKALNLLMNVLTTE